MAAIGHSVEQAAGLYCLSLLGALMAVIAEQDSCGSRVRPCGHRAETTTVASPFSTRPGEFIAATQLDGPLVAVRSPNP